MADSPYSLDQFRREDITDTRGVSFYEFRKTLQPRYLRVWLDIILGYLALLFGMVWAVQIQSFSGGTRLTLMITISLFFGYFHAYLQLFFHEASHYAVAKDRKLNDRLANIFIGSIVGQNIRNYRPIHFIHHRKLGTIEDSEHSYFEPLTVRFIIESLTGIRVFKVLLSRKRRLEKISDGDEGEGGAEKGTNLQLVLALLIHGTIIMTAVLMHWWVLIATWLAGFLIFLPFFASVRQLLEHRDEKADSKTDYSKIAHGEVNRMFGTGPIASTLGGAGFNRHLLHHWEPQISYTNLREVERFLMETEAAAVIEQSRTGYFQTFYRLLRWS